MMKKINKWKQVLPGWCIPFIMMVYLIAGTASNTHGQVSVGTFDANNLDQYQPFSFNYGYSRDANIYIASELNTLTTGDTITSLGWYSPYGGNTSPIKIYLKTVGSTTEVVADTWANTIAGATLVYDATPQAMGSGLNIIDITDFTLPANQNLEVLIESNTGGTGLNPFSTGVPKFTYTPAGINSHGYRTVNNTAPSNQTLIVNNQRADIRFGGLTAPSCLSPGGFTIQNITGSAAKIKIFPSGTAPSSHDYYLSTSNVAPNAMTSPTGNDTGTNINLSGLSPSTVYYVWLRSNCGSSNIGNWSHVLSFTSGPPPPANDECANAISLVVNAALDCDSTTNTSTAGATQSSQPVGNVTYPAGANDDIWYEFTATDTAHIIAFTNISGSLEAVLYGGACGSLTYLNSKAVDYYEEMNATGLTVGSVYKLRLYSPSPDDGTSCAYTICIKTIPPPPANDDCLNASTLTINNAAGCANAANGTTVSATQSNETNPSSQTAGSTDDDVWYQFTANSTIHRVTLSDFSETMVIALYNGSCGSLAYIEEANSGFASTIVKDFTGLTPGTVYKLRVFTYSSTGDASTFKICVGPPPPPPANDNCINAVALTANTGGCSVFTQGTTLAATQSSETIDPSQTGSGTNDDVWYKFTATDTAHRITLFNISGSTSDMEMAVYSGACGNLIFKQVSNFYPYMDIHGLNIGEEYKVRVYTFNAAASDYADFSICLRPVPPVNDEATGALTLTVGGGLGGAPYNNAIATQSTGEPTPSCVNEEGHATMWYKFIAPASGMVRVACDDTGTMGDSRIAVYSTNDPADYSTFNILACDNNNGYVADKRSVLYAANLTAGNTYYIAVDFIFNFNLPNMSGTYNVTVDNMNDTMLATAAADCSGGQNNVNVDTAYHGWLSMVDNEGKLIANVRQLAGSANQFRSSVTTKTGSPRTDSENKPYLNRNYLIRNIGTATSADVQLFFTDAELSNIGTSINSLNITKVAGSSCVANFAPGTNAITYIAQSSNAHPVAGVNYIQFNTPGFSNFYIMPGTVPLPLKLVSFEGKNKDQSNVLTWKTADEKNCSHFELQRSADGIKFSNIAEVKCQNLQMENSYQFADWQPLKGQNFYRLNMVTLNGKSSLSNVVLLNANGGSKIVVNMMPNPVKHLLRLTLEGKRDGNATIRVTDIVGKVVKIIRMDSDVAEIDMSGFANGTYIIRYKDSSNSFVNKVIKQ